MRIYAAAIIAAFLAPFVLASGVTAQDWPNRPITMVVPFAPGGGPDAIGRILAPQLSEILGQQVIVENVGGAGGMIGSARVVRAAPDGYQFVLGNIGTHAQNQTIYKNPLYSAATDFAPVALISEQPFVLVARNDLPVKDLRQFIAYAKAQQPGLRYGSSGAGSPNHLVCALLNTATGIDAVHVPYRGAALALQDLIGGRIDYLCAVPASLISHIQANLVRALATLAKRRSSALPDLQTADEQGLAGFDATGWVAAFFPRDTPAPIVRKLHDAIVTVLDMLAVQGRLKAVGSEPVAPERGSTEYLKSFVASEIKKWAEPIKAAGVTAE